MTPAQYRYMKRAMKEGEFGIALPGRPDVGFRCKEKGWVERGYFCIFRVTPAGRAAVAAYEKERER